ncbi:MAG: nuclear transport factor 2 family protein [Acidimicrobiales bacterium]
MAPDPRDFSEPSGEKWEGEPSLGPVDAAVLKVNAAFYEAFESSDLDAMSDLWVHADRVVCVHPGWTALRGWASVAASWAAMFGGPQHLQFIVTDEHVSVNGDIAWVSCDENLLTSGASATVNALNIFERSVDGRWQMVAHHGAPVMVSSDDDFEEEF